MPLKVSTNNIFGHIESSTKYLKISSPNILNSGLHYHLEAPWAVDADVQLELERIAQEMVREMGYMWDLPKMHIQLIMLLVACGIGANQLKDYFYEDLDHIDALPLGNCGREEKLMVKSYCLAVGYEGLDSGDSRESYNQWTALLVQLARNQVSCNCGGGTREMGTQENRNEDFGFPDKEREEVVLDLYVNDGEGGDKGQAERRTENGEVNDETSLGGQPKDTNGGDEEGDWETCELDI
ncbi:hypothetical protein VP01_4214g1 [Puccinia sorghi]|uniref:Uncharacterized protein n=1 Tax=Puccinia sorghi TaxID=27349 RepID=A0A0L6USP3_9BASI|nr:hypothetical protein VP01_4214g1 [Puccinia sorghi]